MQPLLQIENLHTYFFTSSGLVKAINGIDLSLEAGKTLALVGESGCGKSMTALSLLRLVPSPGRITDGRILLKGQDLLKLPPEEMRRVRGNRISMVFQEPMTSLNPVLRVGEQICEGLFLHQGMDKKQALEEACNLLEQVGIPSPEKRLRDYPHQLSGGMRQRVMIAMALACNPEVLVADEPTTALDVTIQAQIMELLAGLKTKRQMATLLITHDLGIVAGFADEVAVMYAGHIVEKATVSDLFENPEHPYTQGLMNCLPRFGQKGRLQTIEGQVPVGGGSGLQCNYTGRCPESIDRCCEALPPLEEIRPGHWVRCWRRPIT